VARLDVARLDDSRQIDPLIRLTQSSAKLVQLRQLSRGQLDAQLPRAICERAHRLPFPKLGDTCPYNLGQTPGIQPGIPGTGGVAIPSEVDTMSLGQASARYLGNLAAGQRALAASEINRFVRKMGPTRDVSKITKLEVERYQQYLADTAGDAATRVEALKLFLSDLKTKKLTETNLGAGLRVRRKGGARNARKEEAAVVELTREGLDQLQSELTHLETVVAPEVRDDLAAAYQDRDFRENAPYDEAKRRMGEVQGQIDRLRGQIKAARVVE